MVVRDGIVSVTSNFFEMFCANSTRSRPIRDVRKWNCHEVEFIECDPRAVLVTPRGGKDPAQVLVLRSAARRKTEKVFQ